MLSINPLEWNGCISQLHYISNSGNRSDLVSYLLGQWRVGYKKVRGTTDVIFTESRVLEYTSNLIMQDPLIEQIKRTYQVIKAMADW